MSVEMFMEFSTFLIGGGVCIGLTVIIYLISTFSIKEKSFEEAIEEQKKRSLLEEQQQKQTKKEKEKKFKKTWNKRSKEKPENSESNKEPTKLTTQAPAVELPPKIQEVPEIQIIEPVETKSKKKVKSSNKSGNTIPTSLPSEEVTISEKVQEPLHIVAKSVPEPVVDKKEKNVNTETKEKEKPKVETKESEAVQLKANEAEKISSETTVPVPSSPVAVTSTNKKKKKMEQMDKVELADITAHKLLSLINEAALGDEESRMLIDALLNKQKEASSWTKKDGQQSKKKGTDKEMSVEHESKSNQSAKVMQELEQEKQKFLAQERMYQEKIAHHEQENQTLMNHLKTAQEHLTTSQEKIKLLEKSLSERDAIEKKIHEEKAELQKKVKKLETDGAAGTEIQTVKKSHEALQKVHNLLVEQHTELVTSHQSEVKNLKAQISELKKHLQDSEEKNASLFQEIENLKRQCEFLETSKSTVEQELKLVSASKLEIEHLQVLLEKTKKDCSAFEAQVTKLTAQTTDLVQQRNELNEEIKSLQEENERLAAQLVSTKERVAGDGQEIMHQNGELNGKDRDEVEQIPVSEHEKLLEEKESVLKQLCEELQSQKAKITTLNEDLETQKRKNNELREKNWKAVDALANAEKMAEQKLKELEKVHEEKLLNLQKELEEKQKLTQESIAVSNASQELTEKLHQSEEKLKELKEESENRLKQLQSEVQKNEELHSKLQRIEDLQKSSENRITEILKTVEDLKSCLQRTQNHTKECLLRIFCDISIDNSLPHEDWLSQFEEQARSVLQAASTNEKEVQSLLDRLSNADSQNADLKAKVLQYETVITDTESVLKKLQDSAKLQEVEWQEKLLIKEQELQQAIKERDSLAAEKETLESTLQQVERLDELQDKLKLLQNTLEAAENERTHLEQKCDEVSKNYVNLKDQLDVKNRTIEDLQKEVENLKKELEDIKSKLEKEKKISKDFSAQMIRLNSLVKIGQDALSAEQENVKRLESQLQAAKLATTNGTSINKAAIQEGNESQAKLSSENVKKTKKTDASGKK